MSKNDLIFVNHLAKQVRYSELSTIFKIISRETNIHVWPHKMRHAFSTIAFGIPGLNPKDIANILGIQKLICHCIIITVLKKVKQTQWKK
ncbi:hypothetical protein [Leuconostoc mesenteroides]|uniref:hypothetical protein n=1 Tax=Leuconostoc mesenteroides TaxID=1245 RepID=UPI0030CA4ABC